MLSEKQQEKEDDKRFVDKERVEFNKKLMHEVEIREKFLDYLTERLTVEKTTLLLKEMRTVKITRVGECHYRINMQGNNGIIVYSWFAKYDDDEWSGIDLKVIK